MGLERLLLVGRGDVVLVVRVHDLPVLEIIRPILDQPIDVGVPLIPRFLVFLAPGSEGLELRLGLVLLPTLPLFFPCRLEPLREVLRIPSLKPRRLRVLGIVGYDLIGLV
jgi:hypothetical protein